MRLSCSVGKTGCWICPVSWQTGVSITNAALLHLILIETRVAGCLRTNAKD